jgi:hypothetical protein
MNLNKLAKEVTPLEGGKASLPIGQVKEVMKLTLKALAKEEPVDVLILLRDYNKPKTFLRLNKR